jgi:hypothetical protein
MGDELSQSHHLDLTRSPWAEFVSLESFRILRKRDTFGVQLPRPSIGNRSTHISDRR